MIKINKEYKIYKVTRGNTKTGAHYTSLKIKENLKDPTQPSGWAQMYYKVYIGTDCPDAYEGGTIKFSALDGVSARPYEYQGKQAVDVTIYPSRDSFVFTAGDASAESVNANPWGNEDLPF